MMQRSPTPTGVRRISKVFPIAALLICACAAASGAGAQTVASPVIYEYVYPHNTPDLEENHYIVLNVSGAEPRGWYWGTSDEFDQGREGYLPGFFVAPMSEMELTATTISFTLNRPARFFASPVPLEYRSVADVPADLLEEWSVSLPASSQQYVGTLRGEEISLDVPGGPRVFRRRHNP